MSSVQFNTIKPSFFRPLRALQEILLQLLHFLGRQRPRNRILRNRRRNRRLANQLRRRPEPSVMQLNRGDGTVFLDFRSHFLEPVEVLVAETTELPGESLPAALDVRGGGHHQPEAALGAEGEPVDFIARKRPIGVGLGVCKRSELEPVQPRGPAGESERGEEVGLAGTRGEGFPVSLSPRSSASSHSHHRDSC